MPEIPSDLARDYFIATRHERATNTWGWEIYRRSTPLGIRLYHGGFVSESAAKIAGEKSLRVLLDGIVKDG